MIYLVLLFWISWFSLAGGMGIWLAKSAIGWKNQAAYSAIIPLCWCVAGANEIALFFLLQIWLAIAICRFRNYIQPGSIHLVSAKSNSQFSIVDGCMITFCMAVLTVILMDLPPMSSDKWAFLLLLLGVLVTLGQLADQAFVRKRWQLLTVVCVILPAFFPLLWLDWLVVPTCNYFVIPPPLAYIEDYWPIAS